MRGSLREDCAARLWLRVRGQASWWERYSGIIGAVVTAYAGYYIRRGLVLQTHVPDFVVAVIEDLLAISGGLYLVSRL